MIIIETFQRGCLAALSAGGIHRRDQDRHIMIRVGSRQHSSAALLLRRLSTGNDHARRRAARTTALSFNLRCATPVLPIAIGRPSSPPHRPLPKQAINAPRQQTASAEIPIASDAPASPHLPRFPPLEVCVRRPPVCAAPPSWGRHPKTFTTADSCTAAICSSISIPLIGAMAAASAFTFLQ